MAEISYAVEGRRLSDCFFGVPAKATEVIEVLECANGLRPLSDLDALVFYDERGNDIIIRPSQ